MSEKIVCHFWDAASGAGKLGACKETAEKFVRVEHSGRLCPLCGSCLERYEGAQRSMSEEARAAMPGGGKYAVVELSAGAEEYSRQPPKP